MKKIRRWLLVFAVIIALMVRVDGLKATSLIFGRAPATSSTSSNSNSIAVTSTTTAATTTTTEETSEDEEQSGDQGEEVATKAPLTGIPQVDYVWDPNLPRELNGYNLSSYPFLDSVPADEDIGFTCDPKLHDGFYASIKYNCQLYHHCINGIRYDFLCANYTAFDQKTFICHFASEVDCKNSPKYWFRNEPLYKATTTTTQKPAPTTPTTPAPTTAASRLKPLRKPVRRRRPVDYYYDDDEYEDDYYEERPRRRKNRPRNRRPIYDDDYEDDEQSDRRPVDRYRERERERDRHRDVDEDDYDDRRPYRSRTKTRNNDRRNGDDDRRFGFDDKRRDRDRRPLDDERRKPVDDDRRSVVEEERPSDRRKRPASTDRRAPERRPSNEERRPLNEDRRSFSGDDKRKSSEDRSGSKRPYNDDRRADYDDDEEEDYSPRRPEKRPKPQNDVVTVKPSGSTIYDRPRTAPRINRPVPLNEKNKYSYGYSDQKSKKAFTTPVPVSESEPEYYDEYEDEPKKTVDKRKSADRLNQSEDKRQSASSDVVYYDDMIVPKDSLPQKLIPGNVKKPEGVERVNSRDNSELANRYSQKNRSPQRAPKPEYAENSKRSSKPGYVEDVPLDRPRSRTQNGANQPNKRKQSTSTDSRKSAPVQSNSEYETASQPAEVPVARGAKRPFLPSRGGNPYAARGLQPVGKQAQQQRPTPAVTESEQPAAFRVDAGSSSSSSTTRPNEERVKTLDQLYDEEFDVTLNDALNPTLKPLTRSVPQTFFRNRYIHQSSDSEFVPFEPSYAPSEFRRSAVRAPAAVLHHQPSLYIPRGHPVQRYEYEYEY